MTELKEILQQIKQANDITANRLDDIKADGRRIEKSIITLDGDIKKLNSKFDEINKEVAKNQIELEYCKKDINNLWSKLRDDRSELLLDFEKELDENKKECIQEIKLSASRIKLWVALGVISALATVVVNILGKVL